MCYQHAMVNNEYNELWCAYLQQTDGAKEEEICTEKQGVCHVDINISTYIYEYLEMSVKFMNCRFLINFLAALHDQRDIINYNNYYFNNIIVLLAVVFLIFCVL